MLYEVITDLGRDILSRLIYGARVSLMVSMFSVGLAFSLGTFLGSLAGYYKGTLDSIIMRIMDIILAFPYLLLAIVVVAYLGPSLENAMMAIGITYVPRFARIVRGSVLVITSYSIHYTKLYDALFQDTSPDNTCKAWNIGDADGHHGVLKAGAESYNFV